MKKTVKTIKPIKTQNKSTNAVKATNAPVAKKVSPPSKKQPVKTIKPQAQKELKRDEFRKNKVSGHPAYIYKKVGRKYVYVGITHAEITDGTKNIKLEKNPNPKDQKDAYLRPKSEKQKENKFSKKPYKGWSFTKKDKIKVEKIKKIK